MKFSKLHVLFAVFGIFLLANCTKDVVTTVVQHYSPEDYAKLTNTLDLPENPHDYNFRLPNHLSGRHFQINPDLATLGRVIFYDKKVSANNSISCAGCHEPEQGFADGRALSEGFDGELTDRNSLGLGSVVNFKSSYGQSFSSRVGFFWDERAESVEAQSFQTIQNPIEMGMDMDDLGDKLMKEDYYEVLFDKAFHPDDKRPLDQKILLALSEFVNSIASFDSKFDRARNGSPLTLSETNGMALYNENCASCHGSNMSTLPLNVANNGLDMVYADKGVGGRTHDPKDNGVFKIPMLRNVAVTQPYMHDGRFETLEEVVEHYSSGIQNHENLHENLRDFNGQAKAMNFTEQEKKDLVAFMRTLTDIQSLMHERYADPFK